jgi:dienelactone hydrolase
MIRETYQVTATESFDIEVAPAPTDGKRYPMVVVLHGNFGLVAPFGEQLRSITEEIAALGYLAALPSYYETGASKPTDADLAAHVPALVAAIKHLSGRADADPNRLALVGFSLGGGIAASYVVSSSVGSVRAFVDYYGYVQPLLGAGIAKFPPTIIFHNTTDPIVPVAKNSEPLADALAAAGIEHEPVRPYTWYSDNWEGGALHAFRPGGPADLDSRKRCKAWLTEHLPPTGFP